MKRFAFILALFLGCMPVVSHAQTQSEELKKDVITQPEYKGGFQEMHKFIMENFVYPTEAQKRSVSGTIEVEFTVEKSGDLAFVGILKGLEPSVDEELVRVFKAMPRWTPATLNGTPVKYKVAMPITLKLSRAKNSAKSSMAI